MNNRIKMMLLMSRGVPQSALGAYWGGVADPTLTRLYSAVGLTAEAGVDAGAATNDFDSIYPWSDMTEVTDGYGNVFIRIPRFFIKKIASGTSRTWIIDRNPFSGAYLPEPFKTAAYVDVGKYNGYINAGSLESKTALFPTVGQTIVQYRTAAQANGAGYYQMDIHVVDLIRTLFYIEFATLNSQAIMRGFTLGRTNAADTATANENAVNRVIVSNATAALYAVGQTVGLGTTLLGNEVFSNRIIQSIDVVDVSNKAITVDGAAFNVAIGNIIYNLGWKSGFSASITAKSGSLVSNINGLYPCKYREIENPWGNVCQYIDGVNINEHQAWVCRTPADYACNVFAAPYEQLSYVNHNVNGYIAAMGYDNSHPFAEFPSAVGGAATTYYADYYYQTTGQRALLMGGGLDSALPAGITFLGATISSASVSSFIFQGGRLVKAGA
jgi:hypothetical protein